MHNPYAATIAGLTKSGRVNLRTLCSTTGKDADTVSVDAARVWKAMLNFGLDLADEIGYLNGPSDDDGRVHTGPAAALINFIVTGAAWNLLADLEKHHNDTEGR